MAEHESSQRPIWPYIVGAVVLALAVGGFFLVRDLIAFGRPAPEFPALADAPDPSLHGTVAYFAVAATDPKEQATGGCVRVIATAGSPSREVLCITEADFDTGPQLAFLPDGRLEVTMFSWPTDQPLVVAWQKIVDVRTGETEDVPAAQWPAAPAEPGPTVSSTGAQIRATSRNNTAELVLIDATGASRLLWSAEVNLEYSMQVTWAPNGEWALASDPRLLVVTVGDPAEIRVLVEDPTGLGGWGSTEPPIRAYAVTGLDLLAGD